MNHKKKSDTSQCIVDLLMMILNFFGGIHDVASLAHRKVQLAKKRLLGIVTFSFLVATLLSSTWFSGLVMLAFYWNSLHIGLAISVLTILFLNILLIVTLCLVICNHKKNLLFKLTAKQCQRLWKSLYSC